MRQALKGPRRDARPGASRRFDGPGDVLLALRVAWWLTVAPLLFKHAGMERTLRFLGPREDPGLGDEEALGRARRVQRYADGLMRRRPFGPKPVCWRRALVVFRLLRPRFPGEVRILFGVEQGPAGDLVGHAWVERDGVALDGTEPGRYRITLAYPPGGPR